MIKIFNTFNKKKEELLLNNNIINIYVCGVTVYSHCHIGHARTFIIFDILIKYLLYLGHKVNYVRNITDIDDKIIDLSNKNKINFNKLTNKSILDMNIDFKKLNIKKPNFEPKVTECIPEIIELINILLKKNVVYISKNGDLLFSIKSFSKYGLLSGINLEKLKNKNYYNDFIVWKLNNNYPNWNSPWGYGRPGWHIECSSISKKYIKNNTIDIHGGGIDLLFPHHENELAQSYSGYNNFNIKIWMHVGSVIFFNEKMSKSLNNSFSLKEIFKYFNPEIIRNYLILKHYKNPISFNFKNIEKSKKILNKLYLSIHNFKLNLNSKNNINSEFTYRFNNALNNNLNIPEAYSILIELSNEINKFKYKNISITNNLILEIKKLGKILGILNSNSNKFLKKNISVEKINKLEINLLINRRSLARKNKDWETSDKIRKYLNNKGILLIDNIKSTEWILK